MMRPLLWLVTAVLCVGVATAEEKEKDIEELLASMKGMPGMEGIKMFTADDIKNMNPENMGNMFGGPPKKKPRKTRSQYRRQLIEFYEQYGLESKIDGVDAALDKWKGREEKMFDVLHKKYADVIQAKWDEDFKASETDREAQKAEEEAQRAAEAAADSAFGKTEL